jgi:hypothetical protein
VQGLPERQKQEQQELLPALVSLLALTKQVQLEELWRPLAYSELLEPLAWRTLSQLVEPVLEGALLASQQRALLAALTQSQVSPQQLQAAPQAVLLLQDQPEAWLQSQEIAAAERQQPVQAGAAEQSCEERAARVWPLQQEAQ